MMQIHYLKKTMGKEGIALIGAVALLILLGLFTAIIISLAASSSGSFANLTHGSQAFAIAHAGAEWYIEQLNADTNWSNQTTQNRNFAQGSFLIDSFVYNSALDRLTFKSTGSISSSMLEPGMMISRWQNLTVAKTFAPPFRFALFQGMNTGNPLVFTDRGIAGTGVRVSGGGGSMMWYPGNVQIIPINQVDYYIQLAILPNGATVTGPGTYVIQNIPAPYPAMPTIHTSTIYTDEMATYDGILDTLPPNPPDKIVDGTVFDLSDPMDMMNCTSDGAGGGYTCRYQNFITRGNNAIIRGKGTVVAQMIKLHGEDNLLAPTRLDINPSGGGPIHFIANQSVIIGSNNDNPVINSNPNVNFYSRANSAMTQLIHIRGDNTTLGTDKILAERRILVETGASVTNSELYVDQTTDPTNNLIDIVGGGGKTTAVSGGSMVISMSTNNPAIRLRNLGTDRLQTQVTGIIFADVGPPYGYCDINDATVYGSVVCWRFTGNQIANASFTYSDTYVPDPPPQPEFRTHAAKVRDSWDGI